MVLTSVSDSLRIVVMAELFFWFLFLARKKIMRSNDSHQTAFGHILKPLLWRSSLHLSEQFGSEEKLTNMKGKLFVHFITV
jgi:hypothetical protein